MGPAQEALSYQIQGEAEILGKRLRQGQELDAAGQRGSSRENGDRKIASLAMTRGEKGVWSCAAQGAWYGTYYTYHILHSDGVFDTTDPYGVASGIDSERSMVVNLAETDPVGWEQDKRLPAWRPGDPRYGNPS